MSLTEVTVFQNLLESARRLIGVDVLEVEQTTDGKFVVLWLNFQSKPPPKGDTPIQAVEKFIEFFNSKPGEGDVEPDSRA